jgi:hypothetical protein
MSPPGDVVCFVTLQEPKRDVIALKVVTFT